MTKVFIGMPVYNGKRFVSKAIESLLNQSFPGFTLFISDDGSTDGTRAICEMYAKKDPRIIYCRQEKNIGMFPNFKFVLDKADRDFFMWAAQDDIRERDYLKTCLDKLDNNKNLGLATTVTGIIDSFERTLIEEKYLTRLSGKPSVKQVAKYILQPEILGKCNLMYGLWRIGAVKTVWEVYPQRHTWGQDYMFSLALISRFPVFVDKSVLFKKRFGGFSSPQALQNDKRETPRDLEYKNPKNHIFPFGRFKSYFSGHAEVLRGTHYRFLALLLIIRLPRSLFIYLKERNIKKIPRNIAKNTLKLFGLYKTYINIRERRKHLRLHRSRVNSILSYKKRFNPRIFIETGTYKGEMLDSMNGKFEKMYSIELGEELYKKAKEKYKNNKNITLLQGDSSAILPILMKKIKEPALFWLDAHYSGGETVRGNLDTPIEKELKSILNHPIKTHVILIDDARDFIGKNDYPTAEKIKKGALNHGYLFEMKNDNFRIYPKI